MAISSILSLFPFLFIAVTQAYTTFNTKCAGPPSSFSFVSEPDSRGTFKILWSSLFAIFACTWTTQHLNVPEQRSGRNPGWKGDIWWGLKDAYGSLKLALITVIMPEVVIAVACSDLIAARADHSDMKREFGHDPVPWTLSHSYYANMGGFVISAAKSEHHLPGSGTPAAEPSVCANKRYKCYHLTAKCILNLRRMGYLESFPLLTEEELDDKSKGDALIKAIAVAQILWTITEILARATQGLAVSLLEITVLAYAACAVAVYALYWRKPKNIRTAMVVLKYLDDIPEPVLSAAQTGLANENLASYLFFDVARNSDLRRRSKRPAGSPISPLALHAIVRKSGGALPGMAIPIVGYAATTLFGAVHLTTWNFHFPTTADQTAWKCASLYATILGPLLISTIVLLALVKDKLPRALTTTKLDVEKLNRAVHGVLSLGYILARLLMSVEIIRTFLYLPPSAFVDTWASNIPHFS